VDITLGARGIANFLKISGFRPINCSKAGL